MDYVSSVYGFDVYQFSYHYYGIYRYDALVEDYHGSLHSCEQYIYSSLI